jgi:hypothetical protein
MLNAEVCKARRVGKIARGKRRADESARCAAESSAVVMDVLKVRLLNPEFLGSGFDFHRRWLGRRDKYGN